MAVTMTAELADCFETKRAGVRAVLEAVWRAFPDRPAWIFGTDGRFRALESTWRARAGAAAANWLAAATWAARRHPDALLLDVGSTTTDVVPIVGGRVAARGRTDIERLAAGELVYTGVLRTPVCAIVRRVRLRGGWCRVAAEHFAIAADAHRWLGRIGAAEYTCETPDGRGTSRRECAGRLARMVCGDLESVSAAEVTSIARQVVDEQRRQIAAAIRQVVRRLGAAAPRVALTAGCGHALAAEAARDAGLEPVALTGAWGAGATTAPALAVACLLAERLARGGRPTRPGSPTPPGSLTRPGGLVRPRGPARANSPAQPSGPARPRAPAQVGGASPPRGRVARGRRRRAEQAAAPGRAVQP
ncbi:MAG: H4MPT-linked C1 transfer pathway protein [Gemmatimonadetes bacterium]|nr:H4MPT-linked C1 transfer pathway protein [Gemmatimonadota bacterium]